MDQGVVRTFKDEYSFLSNFYPAPIPWRGKVWPTVEHAYQAAKTLNEDDQERIRKLKSPVFAKRAGKRVQMREDWNIIKVDIMLELVLLKFVHHSHLRRKLLDTGDMILEEGNTWGDKVWGICPPGSGIGRNELGKILMDVRETLNDA